MQDNIFKDFLIKRGITESVIDKFNITVGEHQSFGESLIIPIEDTGLNKYRRSPLENIDPRYISDIGLKVTMYGSQFIDDTIKDVLIVEGELDCLVAWSCNIPAISSTAGCKSFPVEWAEKLEGKNIYICYDNDIPGAQGVVKLLKLFPKAKIVLVPEVIGIKDISDFVGRGGNLQELIATGRSYDGMSDVQEDMLKRQATFLPTKFHEEYIKENKVVQYKQTYAASYKGDDLVERAKAVPMSRFTNIKHKMELCIFHHEKTPSMAYYEATNSVYCFGCGKYGDSITVARTLLGLGFKDAVTYLNTL